MKEPEWREEKRSGSWEWEKTSVKHSKDIFNGSVKQVDKVEGSQFIFKIFQHDKHKNTHPTPPHKQVLISAWTLQQSDKDKFSRY